MKILGTTVFLYRDTLIAVRSLGFADNKNRFESYADAVG